MLRPATPLAVLFFVAFVILLVTSLSSPIIKAIPLAHIGGWSFGVFGGCSGSHCIGPKVGYSTDGLSGTGSGDAHSDLDFSPAARDSLSSILIVHPVAAFFSLVCFGLAVAAHFQSPSHSPRFLLALLILTIPTLLLTLLAFLIDILLFAPDMAWGSWIVLAAVLFIVASSVVTCAMRRTLVSRKARKRRIAEDAEMSGANYYNNLAQEHMAADQLPRADSPPPMGTATSAGHGVPQFATFDAKRPDVHTQNEQRSIDDREPLNPRRDPSIRSASTGGATRRPYGMGEDVPPMPFGGDASMPPRRPSRDRYGNPLHPDAMAGMNGDLAPPRLRKQGSQGSMGSNRSDGYQYSRGRGGYGPGPRGYGPQRGGYGPRGGYRGNQPPPDWNGRGRGGGRPPPGMAGRGGGPRSGPSPGYVPDYYIGAVVPGPRRGSSPPRYDGRVADHGAPIGQAIEMDERTGSPATPQGRVPAQGFNDLPQGRDVHSPLRQDELNRETNARSPTSIYSEHAYVPPRAQWQQAPSILSQQAQYSQLTVDTSKLSHANSSNAAPSSTVLPMGNPHISPVDQLPTSPADRTISSRAARRRTGSDSYYEDVDPRFATDEPTPVFHDSLAEQPTVFPSALTPGGAGPGYGQASYSHARAVSPPTFSSTRAAPPDAHHLQAPTPYGLADADSGDSASPLDPPAGDKAPHGALEFIPDGARSPAEGSDTSNFTSISQRGINPAWRPVGGGGGGGSGGSLVAPQRAPVRPPRNDVLSSNPDFALPGGRNPGPAGMHARAGSVGIAAAGPGHARAPSASASAGFTPPGRYPTDL